MTAAPSSALPGISPVRPNEADEEAAVVERAFAAGPYGDLPRSAERRAFERDTAGRAASGAVQRDDVRVRIMRPDEADEVSAMVEAAYAADFELSQGYRADIAAVAERANDHQVWVATDAASGILLGTVSTPRAGRAISPLAQAGELDFRFLGVAAGARRRGIGALLVEHVLLLARLRAIPRVVLNTGPDMVAAQRLYEGMGFHRLREREFVFERPDGSSFLMMAYGCDVEAGGEGAAA